MTPKNELDEQLNQAEPESLRVELTLVPEQMLLDQIVQITNPEMPGFDCRLSLLSKQQVLDVDVYHIAVQVRIPRTKRPAIYLPTGPLVPPRKRRK